MWISFFVSVMVLAALIIMPGYLFLSALRFNRLISLCCGAVVSSALFEIVAVVYGLLNTPISGIILTVSVFIICVLVLFLRGVNREQSSVLAYDAGGMSPAARNDYAALLLYILFGMAVIGFVFIKPLDGACSFSQQSDNITHLGYIKAMSESGCYSALRMSSYASSVSTPFPPGVSSGFYPNAWHIFAAIVVDTFDVSPALAENATNVVFSGIVFPMGCFLFFRKLFWRSGGVPLLLGFVMPLASVSIPLAMYTFGPLYPNAAAYCCLPAVYTIFMILIDAVQLRLSQSNMRYGASLIAFVCCSVGLVFLQPNSIFTAILFLSPYCVYRIKDFVACLTSLSSRFCFKRVVFFWRLIFVLFVVIVWTALFFAPFMQGVVSFDWAAIFDRQTALRSILTLSLRFGSAQVLLSLVSIIGALAMMIRKRPERWTVFSAFISAFIYFVSITDNGFFQSYFSGFWYTDQWRTAASFALSLLPVAVAGLEEIYCFLRLLVGKLKGDSQVVRPIACALVFLTSGVFILGNYCLGYFASQVTNRRSSFADLSVQLTAINKKDDSHVYTYQEEDFVKRVKTILPAGALIINMPFDGSASAYLAEDINVFYKGLSVDRDSYESQLIRRRLSSYVEEEEVKNAIRNIGAKYVLLLDRNGFTFDGTYEWSLEGSYNKEDWSGLLSITDQTPGFELLLQQGNMRLYKMTDL